mmetsp:Transcript_14625/g.29488  ORF Transcript_14625/g.29488 Transcript_14625/m.29488 type:complete len:113 (-) Transcript_14625:490-828(-)
MDKGGVAEGWLSAAKTRGEKGPGKCQRRREETIRLNSKIRKEERGTHTRALTHTQTERRKDKEGAGAKGRGKLWPPSLIARSNSPSFEDTSNQPNTQRYAALPAVQADRNSG